MARAKSTSVEKWFNGFELQIYYSSLVRSKYARVSIVRRRRGGEGRRRERGAVRTVPFLRWQWPPAIGEAKANQLLQKL